MTVYSIEELLSASKEEIALLDGFALQSAGTIAAGIERAKRSIQEVLELGFNLQSSKSDEILDGAELPLQGLTLVFTGEISKGTRSELEKQAKRLGAKVTKAVSKKTDFLVTGRRPSGSKVSAADKNGITVLSEAEYFARFRLSD